MTNIRLRITAAVGAALAAASLAACSPTEPSASGSASADALTVRLKWLHQSQFAGFYAADQRGFYSDANLNVDLEPGGPDASAIQLVASGAEQFGVAGADQILIARGQGVDLVAVAAIYRATPFVLITREDSGITTMDGLAGKTVGVKFGQSEETTYRAMLAASGIDTPEEEPVQFDLGPFLSGNLDAFPGYSINEAIAADESGVPVNLISPSDLGLSLYADTLFTTQSMIDEHPDVVKRFVAATLAGWQWAVDNPDDAAAYALTYDDTLTLTHEQAMMHASLASLKPDDKPLGYMDAAEWGGLQDLLIEQGLLTTPQNIADVFTVAYLGTP